MRHDELTKEEKEAQNKAGLSVLAIAYLVFLLCMLLGGCATETCKEYYESGQLKSDYSREGFVPWSDGDGKVINLPLANPSISGVGK